VRFLVIFGIRLLEAIFAFGIIGSALVVLLAGVEDIREVFKKDDRQRDGAE
jgi:phenylalanyl-tRNA synthetase alpha subunit